jgi:hypothetical protein
MKPTAKEWLKEQYFDEESGDWMHYDFHDAMEAYADAVKSEPAEGADKMLNALLNDLVDRIDSSDSPQNRNRIKEYYLKKFNEVIVALQQQPTAESAEEIHKQAKKTLFCLYEATRLGEPMAVEITIIENSLNEFAALHAQRLADKMVEERMREELIKYDMEAYYASRGHSERFVDDYLQSREK